MTGDWRKKLEQQPGAVLATEMKNNNCKLAKWTCQAVMAGAVLMKIAYISRNSQRNNRVTIHVLFPVLKNSGTLRPPSFAIYALAVRCTDAAPA